MPKPIIEIKHLKKVFGENVVLKDIDFSISKGETVSVIGSSAAVRNRILQH